MSSDTGHGTPVANTAAAPVGAPTTSVADIMRAQAFWVEPQRTAAEVARVLLTRNVQNVIVVDDQRVVGLVGWHDLLGAVLPGIDVLMQADAVPDLSALVALSRAHAHVPVAQIMRPIAFTTYPNTSATRALALMLSSQVPLVPVVDRSRRVVGILTLRELLNALFVSDTPRAAGHS